MSERSHSVQRLLLQIHQPAPLEEIVLIQEISPSSARVLGRRTLQPGSHGLVELLGAGRRARCQVLWQADEIGAGGYREAELEILSDSNFWGGCCPPPESAKQAAAEQAPAAATAPAAAAFSSSVAHQIGPIAQALADLKERAGEQALIRLWSSLVELLEAKEVFTREELIGTLREVGE